MPRGGAREGKLGQTYGNRTDLNQGPIAGQGQTYGKAAAQERALQQAPLPNRAADRVTPLAAPTARPNEPVTAGIPLGPGPGPEVLGPTGDDDTAIELRAIYRLYPDENIRHLIEMYDMGY